MPLKVTSQRVKGSVKQADRAIVNPDTVRPRTVVKARTDGESNPHKEGSGTGNVKTTYCRRLFDAIYSQEADRVKQMIRTEKLDPNITDEADPLRRTPLLLACELQLPDIVRILLKAKPKADVNCRNARGRRPIWWAAKHGNKELTEMLIYDGKDNVEADVLDEDSGCTPLYCAIMCNAPEVCRLLVHAGADVNLRRLWKDSGETEIAESPLIKSVQMGNYEVCDVLINSMCKLQAKTQDGFTALHYAVGYRRYRITDLLLENRIRVNVRSTKGVTAMTVAIREQLPLMCQKLIEWGYDLDKPFKWDETPLDMAIRIHAEGCAMVIVKWGCKIARHRQFWFLRKKNEPPSAFRKAADEGHVRLMKLMIDINPYFLYEDWVREKHIPLALYRSPEFCQWLHKESSEPRSMKVLCKAAVLKHLGRYGCSNLEKLPLPEALKHHLRVDRHFTDKMMRQIDLYEHECPFYCPSLCSRTPQCPEIDFSDSASNHD